MNEIKKIIYLSHDYSGKEENKRHIEKVIKQLIRMFPDHTFLSPVHALGFTYHDLPYDEGMRHCLALLDMCDENWYVKGYCSGKGCNMEQEYSIAHRIPVKFVPDCACCEWNNKRICGVDWCSRECVRKEGGENGKRKI